MAIADVLVVGLAAWRIAHLLVAEDGPFDFARRIRVRAGVYREGEIGFLSDLLSCIWCCSFWAVWPLLGLYALWGPLVGGLAAWGLASLLQGLLEGSHQR